MRGLFGLSLFVGLSLAHYAPPLSDSQIAPPARQFGLPFLTAPGYNTWLLGQLYGNTVGAYRQRFSSYSAGQGIHFGMDFSARCGTPVVAIGDGVVVEVDGPHGSPPHNMVINHSGGLSSFYGHLLERPSLRIGQQVRRGQVIAKSGDSQSTCSGAPHLHLEIRDHSHQRFFNPIPYIAADWDSIALAGSFGGRGFQRDLNNPRRWQQPDQQPQARRGGAILANFARTWPPQIGTSAQPTSLGSFAGLPNLEGQTALQSARQNSSIRQLTTGGCCVGPVWGPDSQTVLFLDKPNAQSSTAIYGASITQSGSPKAMLPVAYFSPDFSYALLPGSPSLIQHLGDGRQWRVDTRGSNVAWSPNNQQIAWNRTSTEGNFDQRVTRVFVSSLGTTPRQVLTLYGGGVQTWLDADTLLLSGKNAPREPLRRLETLNLRTGQRTLLAQANGMRGITASPDGRWIAYYVAFDTPSRNGMFLQSRDGPRRTLGWFGSYRWRDNNRLIYVALKTGVQRHTLMEYNVSSQTSRTLLELPKISYDQWQVSPDGSRVVFLNATDRNLYVAELPR
jgi:hypothetical protein